jgi:hypothetical protein
MFNYLNPVSEPNGAPVQPTTQGGPFVHESMNRLWLWLDQPIQHYDYNYPGLPEGLPPREAPPVKPPDWTDTPDPSGTPGPKPVGIDDNTEWLAIQAVDFSDHVLSGSIQWLNKAPSRAPYELNDPHDRNFLKKRWIIYIQEEHPDFKLTPKQWLILAYCFAYGRAILSGLWVRLRDLWNWGLAKWEERKLNRANAYRTEPVTAEIIDQDKRSQRKAATANAEEVPFEDLGKSNPATSTEKKTKAPEYIEATPEFLTDLKRRHICLLPGCNQKVPDGRLFCGRPHLNTYLKYQNMKLYPSPKSL